MKEINLEEVLNKYSIYLSPYVKEHLQLKAAIKELIYKALDLAAENALVTFIVDEEQDIVQEAYINKQSILQIKDWVK